MKMKTSLQGLMAIASHEGIVLSRYFDSVGIATIGIGHTAAAGHPDPARSAPLSLEGAFALFKRDIEKYEAAVNKAVKVPLKQHEFDACVSFHYNTGAIGRASWVKLLNAGDRSNAMRRIMDWKKPPEIIPRRKAERDLFRTGQYPPPVATVYPANEAGKVMWSKGYRVDLNKHLHLHPPASAPQRPAQPSVAVPGPMPAQEPKGFLPRILAAIWAFFTRERK